MTERILRALSGGLLYIRQNPQFLFTLLLIVVVPVGFVVSGQEFLKASRENQQTLEARRIGTMHDVFSSYIRAVAAQPEKIQSEINALSAQNVDITTFTVAKETPEGLLIIASQDTTLIGTTTDISGIFAGARASDDTMSFSTTKDDVPYWLSTRYIPYEQTGYYLYTEHSREGVMQVFEKRESRAYRWLAGILILVMVLLIRHVRLIDYSYLYREVKKANEMKDLFTNMIAHELRAPLTAMRGYASMIRERGNVPTDIQTNASRIEEASERLIVIVSDLLDVARIQSGKLAVEKVSVDITEVVGVVVEALRPSALEKQIGISLEGVKSTLSVMGDGKRLNQALTNLVSNAIKYTPKGNITISLEDRKDRVEIRVKDTGMGIRAEDQKSLFAPFFRVQTDDVSKITGTGLGMWITKQLIELMGGSIGVESIRGVGTHVVVTLPKK